MVGTWLGAQMVYRIDHYLGKETVQNLLVFRFANAIFEPLWNQKYVDHVQITVAESIGVEGRGAYYEEAGTTRDMVQNHMFQLLCLTAMEPPVSLDADAIRDEKVKVLQALRPVPPEEVADSDGARPVRRGVDRRRGGSRATGRGPGRRPGFAHRDLRRAAGMFIDNWRWAGVPFYLRAGKRMPKRVTEIALQFRDVPHRLFEHDLPRRTRWRCGSSPTRASRCKLRRPRSPGPKPRIQPVSMEFRYGTSFGQAAPRGLRAPDPRCDPRRLHAVHPSGRGRGLLGLHRSPDGGLARRHGDRPAAELHRGNLGPLRIRRAPCA